MPARGEELNLVEHGSFLVAEPGPGQAAWPDTLLLRGKLWYRFMDRIYCPTRPRELAVGLVAELCELRLSLDERLIDRQVHHAVSEAVLRVAASLLPDPGRILDFGTGDGRLLPAIAATFPRSTVAGCDMSWPSLRRGAAPHRRVFQVDPRGALPLPTRSVDLVTSFFVMHFAVPTSMLSELSRIASARAVLVLNTYGDSVAATRSTVSGSDWRQVAEQVLRVPGRHVVMAFRHRGATPA